MAYLLDLSSWGLGTFKSIQRKLEKIVSLKKKGGGEKFSLRGNNLSGKYKLGLSLCVVFVQCLVC